MPHRHGHPLAYPAAQTGGSALPPPAKSFINESPSPYREKPWSTHTT